MRVMGAKAGMRGADSKSVVRAAEVAKPKGKTVFEAAVKVGAKAIGKGLKAKSKV